MSYKSKSLKTVKLYKLVAIRSDTLKMDVERQGILFRIVYKLAPRFQLPHLEQFYSKTISHKYFSTQVYFGISHFTLEKNYVNYDRVIL